MCIGYGAGPYKTVDFDGTLGATWRRLYGQRLVTFLAYQNSIILSDEKAYEPHGWADLEKQTEEEFPGGAMLLPIPMSSGSWYQFFETSEMPKFLEEMTIDPYQEELTRNPMAFQIAKSPRTLDVVSGEIYTSIVFSGASPSEILHAIKTKVAQNRRPKTNLIHLEFFAGAYPSEKWSGILACFDPKQVKAGNGKATPLCLAYQHSDEKTLVFPGIDGHKPDEAPDIYGQVRRNQKIAWSIDGGRGMHSVSYSTRSGELNKHLPHQVYLSTHTEMGPNGDFVMLVDDFIHRTPKVRVWKPPSA